MFEIIERNGVQMRQCNACETWTPVDDLGVFHPPADVSDGHNFYVCIECANEYHRTSKNFVLAKSWAQHFYFA